MDFLHKVGKRLYEIRKQMKLNQQQMGEILGVSRASYSLYENGKLPIDIVMLDKLRSATGISVDYILGYVNQIELQRVSIDEISIAKGENLPPLDDDQIEVVFEPDEEITPESLEKRIMEAVMRELPSFVKQAIINEQTKKEGDK